MSDKIKLLLNKLLEIEYKILEEYKIIAKKETSNEDITNEIEKINLYKEEEKFLYELSYKDLTEILFLLHTF